ncbi:MAG: TatD family hydrolase [Candidatus Taylorbacteria bacterium]
MNLESKFNYIDIHTHVNFSAFDADRDLVVKRALEAGVAMVNVGTQIDTSHSAVDLSEKYESGVYAIVGVHPIHSDKSFHDEKEFGQGNKEFTSRGEVFDTESYRILAKHPKVLAIGECGLDYYRLSEETEKKQIENFVSQIDLANEVGKPLMLHVRNGSGRSAYKEAVSLLKSHSKVRGNFHFFAGDVEEAKEILDGGHSFSFTGVITFAKEYAEVIQYLPMERIMSETDAPYVTPVPYRGKRNEPRYVKEVVKKIAEIKKMDLEAVRLQILENARKYFNVAF